MAVWRDGDPSLQRARASARSRRARRGAGPSLARGDRSRAPALGRRGARSVVPRAVAEIAAARGGRFVNRTFDEPRWARVASRLALAALLMSMGGGCAVRAQHLRQMPLMHTDAVRAQRQVSDRFLVRPFTDLRGSATAGSRRLASSPSSTSSTSGTITNIPSRAASSPPTRTGGTWSRWAPSMPHFHTSSPRPCGPCA